MSYIQTADNTNIYYQIDGDKSPLVFINGQRTTTQSWKKQVNAFSSNYKCISFDHRGVGQSDKPNMPYTIARHRDDLTAIISSTCNTKCTLIAHSIGGIKAIDYAVHYPEKVDKLILINSAAYINFNLELFMRCTVKALKYNDERLLDALDGIGFAITFGENTLKQLEPKFNKLSGSSFASVTLESAINLYEGLFKSNCDYRDKLPQISLPTLIIAGDEDLQFPAKHSIYMNKSINNSKLEILEDCGHFAITEYPEKVNTLIQQFLTDKP